MIKLNYPSKSNTRGRNNDLIFSNWNEYWKTLGYLSNRNIHRDNNHTGNIKIVYENNQNTNSNTGAFRIRYYGDENRFANHFPSLYSIKSNKAPTGSERFRINRNEFGYTLVQDLNFSIVNMGGRNTDIVLPPIDIGLVLNNLRQHPRFNEHAWNEGYNLGNL